MTKWKVMRIRYEDGGNMPVIPGGWEPFGIQPAGNDCYIWLRRRIAREE